MPAFTPETAPRAGRQKGAYTRKSVQEICRKLKCDPIAGMTNLAADPATKPELRGRMFAELASYIYPKLRTIEHSGIDGAPIQGRTVLEVVYADKSVPE
jgi:hypothetical protein